MLQDVLAAFAHRPQRVLAGHAARQPALRQLWVAARSGGFHFDYDESGSLWICDSTREPLGALLNRTTLEQAGEDVDFPGI